MKTLFNTLNGQIATVSRHIEATEAGYFDGTSIYHDPSESLEIVEVELPVDYSQGKYLYIAGEGFVANPTHDDGLNELRAELAAQKATNEDLRLMMADIIASL
ncbi:hypothetical protein [Paenibacillus sp. PAMC21692]|uniref:hypothetical protein n=1 Tax=Paenibacillus sp. PAMC21692 TaxID=2762320 RepID=UPI00164D3CE5|nr:hypothetical protein [Paenibacillus sp. PAMC21692]QNK57538.1 hypothetical protein H7F31_00710 [Paenibacillus sp. PAMC21692]